MGSSWPPTARRFLKVNTPHKVRWFFKTGSPSMFASAYTGLGCYNSYENIAYQNRHCYGDSYCARICNWHWECSTTWQHIGVHWSGRRALLPTNAHAGKPGFKATAYVLAKRMGAKPDDPSGFNVDGLPLIIDLLLSCGVISYWPIYWQGTNVPLEFYDEEIIRQVQNAP